MRISLFLLQVTLLAGLAPAWSQNAQQIEAPEATESPADPSFPIPEDLVLDFRVFESRTQYPDFEAMGNLNFFINTDGRTVTATQWPGTIAKKVPETFLAALIWDTVPVVDGVGRFEWSKGSSNIKTEIRISEFHPAGTFKAQLESQFVRGKRNTKELSRELELQMKRTTVWSDSELEIGASDYISHFREYKDRDNRGQLYEMLRPYTFFLILAVTPRVLTAEEAATARTLSLPVDAELPPLGNPTGFPLQGTIVLGFGVDETGAPVNPQVLRSTLPEANIQVLEQSALWRFPVSENPGRGEVELEIEVPVPSSP